jgi:hypothetical protein
MAQENDAVSAAENIGNSTDTATNVDSAANADPSAVTTGITDALNGTDVSTLTQQQPDAVMSQFAEFMLDSNGIFGYRFSDCVNQTLAVYVYASRVCKTPQVCDS